MAILLANSRVSSNSYAQLLTVLLIFVVVLAATALTTRWIAGYQKDLGRSGNIELLDAVRLGNNKYIQVVRVGQTYVALAVCKDTVTVLCEIPPEQIQSATGGGQGISFKEVLSRIRRNEPEKDQNEAQGIQPKDRDE